MSNIHSIFVYVTTMKVCRVTSESPRHTIVSDQNLMTKAKRVGSLSVRSHYIDGQLAADLLKINASNLRYKAMSFPIVTWMIALYSPVNIEREPLLRQYERIPLRIKHLKINDHVSSQLFILCIKEWFHLIELNGSELTVTIEKNLYLVISFRAES